MIDLLADVVKGGALRVAASEQEAFIRAAEEHGVVCLIAGSCAGAPEPLRERLRDLLRRECLLEELRTVETRRVLAAFAGAGLRALVIKGAALAYTHYAEPWLRPRFDLDLFVAREDVPEARRVLEDLGYAEPPFIAGELVMHQADYRRDDRGVQHRCDLHWRAANPAVFADLLPFDAVARRARPVPALGPAALTMDAADSLLLACVHRVAHHHRERLIWLYDVHLLAGGIDAEGAARFSDEARRAGVHAICADTLRAARRLCATTLPPRLDALVNEDAPGEPSAVFLRPGRRRVTALVWDLRALGSWRARARLMREHLLPPASYMRRTYGVSSAWALPLCYAHRAVTGAARWMRRTE